MRSILNKQGFGLVGVLVAGGVGAIIAFAMSRMVADVSRSQRSLLQTTEAGQLMSQLNILLSNPSVCERNFGPTSMGGAISLGVVPLNRDIVNASGSLIFDVNSSVAYENNSVLIRNYKYEQVQVVSTSPYVVVGRLTFNLEKTDMADNISVGGKNLTRSLILSTTLTGAGGTIVSCSSVGSHTNLVTTTCPAGQAVTGFNSGVPVCSTVVPNLSCPAGEVMEGINAGVAVCRPAPTVVASSLGVNGYIQYSNGFTIQWGQHFFNPPNTTNTINYPVAFAQVYSVIISGTDCPGGNCQDNSASVMSIGLNSFTASSARDDTHNTWWMAYGLR